MREIKLRAWDPVTKRMVYDFITDVGESGTHIITFVDECGVFKVWSYDKCGNLYYLEPLFYIGRKDRNGQEIYDGDIVVIFGQYPFYDGGKPNYVGVIEWDDGGFYMVLRCVNEDKRGISDGVGEFFEDSERYDVIGNIHENPELLPGA